MVRLTNCLLLFALSALGAGANYSKKEEPQVARDIRVKSPSGWNCTMVQGDDSHYPFRSE